MSDVPRSAVELALERLRKKDAEQGVTDTRLSDEQKAEIASVRQTYAAKLAQEEILYKAKLQGAPDFEAHRAIEEHYRRDVERLTHDRDRKIEKIRSGS